MNTYRRTETTLGNLIAALTEEVSRYFHDEKKAYEVAGAAALRRRKQSPGRKAQ